MAKAQEETRTAEPTGQKDTQKEPKAQDQRGKQTELARRPEGRSSETGMAPYRRGGSPAQQGVWGPITRLRDEFDRLFDQFSRGWMGVPMPRWESDWGLDLREDEDNVTVQAAAPGFEPSDFDIQVRGNQLVMCACHKAEEREEGGYRGSRRQEFYESVTLPADVDADKVKAAYRQGMLTVTLPKSEQGKARHIAVEG